MHNRTSSVNGYNYYQQVSVTILKSMFYPYNLVPSVVPYWSSPKINTERNYEGNELFIHAKHGF